MVMKVRLTSPCMAMLLQETAKSAGQCEGYLCGEINVEQSNNITDSEVRVETEEILSVNDVLASTSGVLKTDVVMDENSVLDPCLAGRQVLGWYKFCRRPLLSLTLREKFIHRKLSQRLSNGGYRGQFITILLQEEWNAEKSTHSWQFAAYSLQDSRFESCAIEIVNLKVATCGAYKPFPSVHQMRRLPCATSTLNTLQQHFTAAPTDANTADDQQSFLVVNAVRDASDGFAQNLQSAVKDLAQTENCIKVTLEEQARLKAELRRLEALLNNNIATSVEDDMMRFKQQQDTDTDANTTCTTLVDLDDDLISSPPQSCIVPPAPSSPIDPSLLDTSSSSSASSWEQDPEARTRELHEQLEKKAAAITAAASQSSMMRHDTATSTATTSSVASDISTAAPGKVDLKGGVGIVETS